MRRGVPTLSVSTYGMAEHFTSAMGQRIRLSALKRIRKQSQKGALVDGRQRILDRHGRHLAQVQVTGLLAYLRPNRHRCIHRGRERDIRETMMDDVGMDDIMCADGHYHDKTY